MFLTCYGSDEEIREVCIGGSVNELHLGLRYLVVVWTLNILPKFFSWSRPPLVANNMCLAIAGTSFCSLDHLIARIVVTWN